MSGASRAGEYDVVLIGAGIMSATVGALLKVLDPSLRIALFERLEEVAKESSDAKNNAGTGHAAWCELNYTPAREDGSVDVKKAFHIMECFETSRQLWSSFVERGVLENPRDFIRAVPHLSFVTGPDDVRFLRARFEALTSNHLFAAMQYSDERAVLKEWMPLMMHGRDDAQLAATRSDLGTDVDFGRLTRGLVDWLVKQPGVQLFLDHHVHELDRDEQTGLWRVEVEDESRSKDLDVKAKFVFIGAGGGALDLLDESDIEEGQGYGGFPVSGEWLVCRNPAVVAQHAVKVYGKAKEGTPPMSVPHLDRRYVDGETALMFGPFAGFSTRFLKEGSYLDLPASLSLDNLIPMISVGLRNLPLTTYLLGQVTLTMEEKLEALREFVPRAQPEDWSLEIAGQRVQVIKRDEKDGGRLEFGTEIISAKDNTLAALLGASPGASTSVSIALDLLADCFPERMPGWEPKLRELIPSWGRKLRDERELTEDVRARSERILRLG
ncbi:MAG: malate dehydrogenase (quinone) [Archangium sp.]|nr:malate dehydrogenase (quinone) [Archangium sp.]